MTIYNEDAVRRLRDAIYGPCSETNWKASKLNQIGGWLTPDGVRWLAEQVHKDAVKQNLKTAPVDQLISACVTKEL